MRETKKTNIMATYRSMKDNAYNQKLNWTNAYDRSKCNYLSWLDNLENCFIPKNSLLLKLCNQSHLMNIIGEERFYTITNIWQLHICCKCHYKVGVIHENYCITFCCQQYMIQITDKHRYYNPLWWLLQEIQRDIENISCIRFFCLTIWCKYLIYVFICILKESGILTKNSTLIFNRNII